MRIVFALFVVALTLAHLASGQPAGTHYDESLVPQYTLPDPLVASDGSLVGDRAAWAESRRPEILRLFETHVYGKTPPLTVRPAFRVRSVEKGVLGGKATRKLVSILFSGRPGGPEMDLMIYVPADADGPVPLFIALNFQGNHSIHPDPAILLSTRWMRIWSEETVVDHLATEKARGVAARRWPLETILDRGYGLATAYYGDIDPDYHDGFRNGVHALFPRESQEDLPGDAWGSVGAWAWGLSRAMDYLQTDRDIDGSRVALLGHSRLGKAALWAGAQDERFAIVISNESGCGGAALSRRRFGETVQVINDAFPHWFCHNFAKFNNNENGLPVDQHMLLALVAPRPLYVASAAEDLWCDPKGEFLAALAADPVYRLLGTDGLPAKEMPAVNQPVAGTIGYHIRDGVHDVTDFDWEQFLKFADRHFGR